VVALARADLNREPPSPQFREKLGEQMLDMMEVLLRNTTGSAVARRLRDIWAIPV
jgi:hypothetical protein